MGEILRRIHLGARFRSDLYEDQIDQAGFLPRVIPFFVYCFPYCSPIPRRFPAGLCSLVVKLFILLMSERYAWAKYKN